MILKPFFKVIEGKIFRPLFIIRPYVKELVFNYFDVPVFKKLIDIFPAENVDSFIRNQIGISVNKMFNCAQV